MALGRWQPTEALSSSSALALTTNSAHFLSRRRTGDFCIRNAHAQAKSLNDPISPPHLSQPTLPSPIHLPHLPHLQILQMASQMASQMISQIVSRCSIFSLTPAAPRSHVPRAATPRRAPPV